MTRATGCGVGCGECQGRDDTNHINDVVSPSQAGTARPEANRIMG